MSTIDPLAPEIGGSEVVDEDVRLEAPDEAEAHAPTARDDRPAGGAEPTEATLGLEVITGVEAVPLPITPIPITRTVSGRYTNCPRPWKLELRVDVDGHRPMKRVSGDYFNVTGSTTSYFGSFVVNAPTISVTSSAVTITGIATTTWATAFNKLQVVIPRHSIFLPPANAYAQWMTASNVKGAAYTCVHDSPYQRTVDLEQDHEKGVTAFSSYNTGSLPSGGPARILSVAKAYAEAGIEMRDAGIANEVPTAPGSTWSNAELHAAMVSHFSLWKDEPQWKVWLFHALRHDYGPGLLGIMFDQMGKQRQGCAVFYQSIGGTTAVKLRDQLYTCVHELGHCFNLYHSFHKQYMNPPVPNRPDAKSWMNYPQLYPGGAAAFWSAFPFQFDNLEVIHLRHAYRNNIIIGGNPFGTGAAMESTSALADNIVDNSGLRLELRAKKSFALGEPVVAEIKLETTDLRGKRVHAAKQLHPNFAAVQIAVQGPSGEVSIYHPPLDYCAQVETTMLDENNRAIYASAYIGYDHEEGHLFDHPGMYRLRGIYYALDGSVVLSDVVSFRVRSPIDRQEEEIADLLLGDEQGMQLYLLGSDSPHLENGAEALELLADKHADHPLAVYAQLVKGYNASREFKTISSDYQVSVRQPDIEEAKKALSAVVDASTEDSGVDNITLNAAMRRLARAELIAGKKREAQATLNKMVNIFKKKELSPLVMAQIEKQVEAVLKHG